MWKLRNMLRVNAMITSCLIHTRYQHQPNLHITALKYIYNLFQNRHHVLQDISTPRTRKQSCMRDTRIIWKTERKRRGKYTAGKNIGQHLKTKTLFFTAKSNCLIKWDKKITLQKRKNGFTLQIFHTLKNIETTPWAF